jgi:ABC-type multidrug transport system fused ATPase/permease subunit
VWIYWPNGMLFIRAYFMHFNKTKIENLFYSLENFITETKLKKHQSKVIQKLTRFIILMLVIFLTTYFFALFCNYITFKKEVDSFRSGRNLTLNATVEKLRNKSYIQIMQSFLSSSFNVSIYLDSMYILCAIGLSFLIVTDVLFYSIYWLIIAELGVLTEVLVKYINDKDKMDWWLRSHHHLMR